MFQSVLRCLRDTQAAELEDGVAGEAGFTLIELMVVLLIIAILLAIAIPTFLGVTGSANDRASQSNLTNALTEASAVYQANNQSYLNIQTALSTSAPEFTWVASGASPTQGSNQISVATVDVAVGQTGTTTADSQGVELASYSKTGTCWWVVQLNTTPAIVGTEAGGNVAFARVGLSGAAVGDQNGATTAGTYYAKSNGATSATCMASYPQTDIHGFTWYSSYSTAVTEA